MDEAVVYADVNLPTEAMSSRNLASVQHSDHRPCPCWHWIVLWVGLVGNIVLVAAVIAIGVWCRNKTKEVAGASSHSGGEGNRTLEEFKSRLKEEFCVNSAENGSCRLCPSPWHQYKENCYWLSTASQSWKEGSRDCKAKKSQLLLDFDPNLEKELDIKNPVWIGLHFAPTEKKWLWVNGFPLNETQYPALPPEKDQCGTLKGNRIEHEKCSQDHPWICQKESVLL